MSQAQSIFGSDFGKKAIRVAITIVGLLILRAILGSLPMLANASAIGSSLMSPLVIANAIVDTLLLVVILRFGITTGRLVGEKSTQFPDIGRIISLATLVVVFLIAYRQYETPTACLLVSPADLTKVGQTPQSPNLDQIAPGLSDMYRGIARAEAKMFTGATLAALQGAAVTILRQAPDIYGWAFLVLIAIPVVGIVVLGYRNLDGFTEAIFHAASVSPSISRAPAPIHPVDSVAGVQCSGCGQPVTSGTKFCPSCGTALGIPTSISSGRKICSSCGSDNLATARFCRECGQAA